MKTNEGITYYLRLVYRDESEEQFTVCCSGTAAAMMLARGLMLTANDALFCMVGDIEGKEIITFVV